MFLKRILTYSILSLATVCTFFASVSVDVDHTGSILASVSLGESVYAEDKIKTIQDAITPSEAENAMAQKMFNELVTGLNIILAILTAIVSPAIMFAGWLMSPDWTSGDLFNLREPMHNLWVTVSNIVYFIYAILLIIIALGTMFGNNVFSYRTMLPKLALGILMVPFSWWFVQWTISISAIVTASVITIPNETIHSLSDSTDWINTKSMQRNYSVNNEDTKDTNATCPTDGPEKCISPMEILQNGAGMYSYMMVYGYSIFKIQDVQKLSGGTDIIKNVGGIVHQSIIAAIMFLLFGLLTLALVAILFLRAIKLWIYAIFSPLFTFRFIVPTNLLGSSGDSDDSFTIKEFIGLCFVPAIVGLILGFGLIMINAVSSASSIENNGKTEPCTIEKLKNPGCPLWDVGSNSSNSIIRKIGGTGTGLYTINEIKFGGITTTYYGKSGASTDDVLKTTNGITGVLNSAGGVFGTLIIDIIALLFIWFAFMAAKGISKIAGKAIAPFEKIGQQIGSMPKYIPLPIPGGSISGALKAKDELSRLPENMATKNYKASRTGQWFQEKLDTASYAETQKLREAITSAPDKIKDSVKMSQNGFRDEGIKTILNNEEAFKKNIDRANYNSDQKKKILDLIEKAKKDGKLDENDAAMLQVLMSGQTPSNLKDAKDIIAGWKEGKGSSSSTSGGANSGANAGSNINLNINNNATHTDIASAINGSNDLSKITKDELQKALREKIKNSDNTIDEDKINKILEALKDNLKK